VEAIWFCLVAVMIALYVVFDGFDIGAGIVSPFVARTREERRQLLGTIGPVWDGNEVWLLAGGGTLYFAFPKLYASSFSGFYLPLMMVLWLLILRGISIEFRNHITNAVWTPFWDATFALASTLLAIFFGAALGNVVRGVPLDANGRFFEPLWTNFMPGAETGILDWYTVVVGVAALVALAMHGALWVALKADGAVGERARAVASRVWWAVLATTVAVTLASFAVQPVLRENLARRPWGFVFPALALGGLVFVRRALAAAATPPAATRAFLASCAHLVGMLTGAAWGLFPYVLPSSSDPALGLTVYNAAAARSGLAIGFFWWIPGMALVAAYFVFAYRQFHGKVGLADADAH